MDKLILDQLFKYRFNPSLKHAFNVADLLDETYLRDFMKNLSVAIGAPSEKIAASIFIKRYAFLAVMSLYTMTALNKNLNVSLDNVKMESAVQGIVWLPGISIQDAAVQDWDGNDRSEWRSRVLNDLFANNIYPLITQLEKTIGISKLILWENIAVYLFWLYETELKGKEHAEEDFRYLISEAKGKLFGCYNINPLPKYFTEKTYLEEWDTGVRVRKTCCFTYQMPAGKRCKTCPCTHITIDRRCHDGESICEAVRSFA
ncbi:IucA/IucC family C-terminal-domain containing protein [Neobacillus drentensis]|uniref:IucA/IucC family C-terminal-domain containing protein n=1 Tax=Neobacillus drentensis TaxID=220684 RepID=UPI002FFD9093